MWRNPSFSDGELGNKFSKLGKYVQSSFTDISAMASFVMAGVPPAASSDCTKCDYMYVIQVFTFVPSSLRCIPLTQSCYDATQLLS
jgi:hypothetical protein